MLELVELRETRRDGTTHLPFESAESLE